MNYRRMIYNHRVKKYSGKITLIVNERHFKVDNKMGWGGVPAGGLEVICTPGDHWTRYTRYGKEFAQRLLACLERAQSQNQEQPQSAGDTGKSRVINPQNADARY
jgi:hypothetical protein